jgi:hypothetical protein
MKLVLIEWLDSKGGTCDWNVTRFLGGARAPHQMFMFPLMRHEGCCKDQIPL